MKLAARDIERFLDAPPEDLRACLIYGGDAGQVREQAKRIAKTVCPDLDDPFRVATIDGASLSADPARLADEAAAMAFGGGRRVIRLRNVAGDQSRYLADVVKTPPGDALIVAEAGVLRRDAAIVKLFESAPQAAAVPCYADEGRALLTLLDKALKDANVRLSRDAHAYVVARLGADRGATRMEIEKLVLYAEAGGEISLDEAIAAIGDAGASGTDDLVYAVASGDITALHRTFDRLMADGVSPIAVVRGLMMHMTKLRAVTSRAESVGLEAAISGVRPPIFFKRKSAFEAQARKWTRPRLSLAVDRLLAAEIELKSTGVSDTLALWRACFDVARAGRSRV
jgi:DNA polymerase-3 subunit delta